MPLNSRWICRRLAWWLTEQERDVMGWVADVFKRDAVAQVADRGYLNLSRFDAAPLIEFTATKETDCDPKERTNFAKMLCAWR